MAFRLPAVQTYVTAKVAEYLSDELNSHIAIERVHFQFLDQLQLRGLYVEDQNGDTLLYTDRLRVNLHFLRFNDRVIEFDVIQFDNPQFYLTQFPDSVGGTNMDFIIQYFTPAVRDTTRQKPFSLYSDDIRFNNAHFRYRKVGAEPKSYGVDFGNLDITEINISLQKVELLSDTLYAEIHQIALKDESGFTIDSLAAVMKLSSGSMEFLDLDLKTPNSEIITDLEFRYERFRSFRNFVDSVYIRSDFSESDLDFTDISYFAPDLEGFHQQLQIDGRIRGTVSDLRGSQLKVGFGDHSYFLGDCSLTGLPDLENTFIDLNIQKLSTTASDLKHIQMPPFKEEKYVQLPDQFDELGTIVFNGEFIGFYSDFVAFGNMRSQLGKIAMDIGFTLDSLSSETQYTGELESDQFDFQSDHRTKRQRWGIERRVDDRSGHIGTSYSHALQRRRQLSRIGYRISVYCSGSDQSPEPYLRVDQSDQSQCGPDQSVFYYQSHSRYYD